MIRKLVSETILYGGTTILVRLISYALTPLHVTVFTPDNFGIVSEFYAYAVLANVIYTYGMETAFFRYASSKKENIDHYLSTALSTILTSSFLLSFLLFLFAEPLAIMLGYAESGAKYITWFAILFAIDAIVAIPFALLRLEHKAKRFAFIKIGNAILILLFNVFFLYFCRHIYEGRYLSELKPLIAHIYKPEIGLGYAFLSNLFANALLIPMHIPIFLRLKFKLNWSDLKPLYLYGYPIMLSGLAFAINETADRIFIKYLLPDDFYSGKPNQYAVGVYSACYKLSIFITMAVQAFKYAAEPFFFSKANDKDAPSTYALILDYFIVFCCVVIVFVVANLSILSPIIIPNKDYWDGLPIVPILLFANLFLGVYYNLSVWFKLTDRTIYGAYMSMIGASITVISNLLLIPYFGFYGSAIATLLCYFGIALISLLWGKKYYPIPYKTNSAMLNLGVAAIFVTIMFFWITDETYKELVYKNTLFFIFVTLVLVKYKAGIFSLLKK